MDIMTSVGLISGIIVIAVMVFMGGDLHMFGSEHAMIISFGGSIAATMIRLPLGVMLHVLPLVDGEAGVRLVEQQNLGVLRQRHGDLDPATFAIGGLR